MSTKLGQNFLTDKKIAEKEIQTAKINKKDIVLEIGPGNGILTNLIARNAKKVIAIEIDRILVDKLKNIILDNVEIINDDVLKTDFTTLPKFNKIVSNLPFQISSPVTFKILDHGFDLAVLIYQREFAQRMVAKPGNKDYSRLSVNVYYKSICNIVQMVPKNCFSPVPKVDAYMVTLSPRKTPAFKVKDEKFFYNLTKNLFNHRRKKIRSILKNFYPDINFENVPFLDNRVEDLSPEEIGNLSNIMYDMLNF